MEWKELSLKANSALILTLVATVPAVTGIAITAGIFEQTAPVFVYALPAIWVILFFAGLAKPKAGLIAGIIWGIMNLFIPVIPLLQGIENPIADALRIPVCPFAMLGIILSVAVIYLCSRAYMEVRMAEI